MNRQLGAFGEAWAAGQLARQGYRIVDRNVRYRVGELDLVAYDGEELVFVEVKTRRTSRYGSPQESITAARFAHIERAIDRYLAERELTSVCFRLDVVAIEVGPDGRVRRFEVLRGVGAPGS